MNVFIDRKYLKCHSVVYVDVISIYIYIYPHIKTRAKNRDRETERKEKQQNTDNSNIRQRTIYRLSTKSRFNANENTHSCTTTKNAYATAYIHSLFAYFKFPKTTNYERSSVSLIQYRKYIKKELCTQRRNFKGWI